MTVSVLMTADTLTINSLQQQINTIQKLLDSQGSCIPAAIGNQQIGNQQRTRQTTQKPKKPYQPKSDGPEGSIKTTKFYDNNNCCWSHGYNMAEKHTSGNYRFPLPGHGEVQKAHTGNNPVTGTNQKDKEFSQWAGQAVP